MVLHLRMHKIKQYKNMDFVETLDQIAKEMRNGLDIDYFEMSFSQVALFTTNWRQQNDLK